MQWKSNLAFLVLASLAVTFSFSGTRRHQGQTGGMTSFMDQLLQLQEQGTQIRSEAHNSVSLESVSRFLDPKRVRNGPKFPVDLELKFTTIRTKPGQRAIKA
jgi:hypothetical protein